MDVPRRSTPELTINASNHGPSPPLQPSDHGGSTPPLNFYSRELVPQSSPSPLSKPFSDGLLLASDDNILLADPDARVEMIKTLAAPLGSPPRPPNLVSSTAASDEPWKTVLTTVPAGFANSMHTADSSSLPAKRHPPPGYSLAPVGYPSLLHEGLAPHWEVAMAPTPLQHGGVAQPLGFALQRVHPSGAVIVQAPIGGSVPSQLQLVQVVCVVPVPIPAMMVHLPPPLAYQNPGYTDVHTSQLQQVQPSPGMAMRPPMARPPMLDMPLQGGAMQSSFSRGAQVAPQYIDEMSTPITTFGNLTTTLENQGPYQMDLLDCQMMAAAKNELPLPPLPNTSLQGAKLDTINPSAQSARPRARRKSGLRVSKYVGVCWNRRAHKWAVQSRLKGRTIYLGYYVNEEEAARRYDKYATGIGRPVNFPKDDTQKKATKYVMSKRPIDEIDESQEWGAAEEEGAPKKLASKAAGQEGDGSEAANNGDATFDNSCEGDSSDHEESSEPQGEAVGAAGVAD